MYVFDHQMGRTGHDVLFGTHFGFAQLQIKVRIVVVFAGSIFAVDHVEGIVFHLLSQAAYDVTFSLLGNHLVYNAPPGVEIVFEVFGNVLAAGIFENRISHYGSG